MGKPSGRPRHRGWKIWLCGIAILGAASAGASAGAAGPTVPGAPTITSVNAGLFAITVAFSKPASDGGARISSYRGVCTSSNGGLTGAHVSLHSPVRVPNLTPGKRYTCTVTASNNVGAGPASEPSSLVIALPTVPGAPTITSVQAIGLRSITVAFNPPASNGRAAITNYKAVCTSSNGGKTSSKTGHPSPVRVSGLTADKTYTCNVAANNRIGPGRPSAPSSAVTTLPTVPGVPTITSAKAIGRRSIAVAFTNSANTGGSPITNNRVECTSSNGGEARARIAHPSPVSIGGLTNGKTYTCTVSSTNGVRFSPASHPSKPVVVRSG